MAYCSNCGTKLQEEFEFCPECGQAVSSEASCVYNRNFNVCKNCGSQMPEGSFYCLNCRMVFYRQEMDFEDIKSRVINTGGPQKRVISTSVGVWKNKWVSLILCIFFGMFGVHRFYEERNITGFIYLFTFGIFGLGWFFDIILILTKPNQYRVK